MNVSGLLTSAGINIAICVVLLSLYSILRKQPTNASVYFGQRLAHVRKKHRGHFSFDRFVPSPGWLVKAWETSEEEIHSIGGLDAVVFIRLIVFSIRTFSIAAIIGTLLVLPVNYFGKDMEHKKIPLESLEAFTIGNVEEGSRWLWVHCLALYILSCSSCILLYFEYKKIAEMRMLYITESSMKPSHFTVLVRSIPWSIEESYNEAVRKFFSEYHPSSYLSHQMVYNFGTMRKLMELGSNLRCGLCNGTTHPFKMLPDHSDSVEEGSVFSESDLREKECPSALVFFKSRYAALTISRDLHSANPMKWVTDYAPEPLDVYWRSLRIPYHQLWIRKIAVLLASIFFLLLFILPATLVQGLVHLDKLQTSFPFLRGILKKKYVSQLVTGYLPSVVLMLFLYAVPPIMMLFSTVEGPISRSKRKKSACYKILFFLIWNVFFVNVVSGKVFEKWDIFSRPKGLPNEFAIAVPSQATFFTTYVLTSGWASVSSELMQPFALICNFVMRHILRHKDDPSYGPYTFPYHTEIPRVLLFGLLGFTLSILAPLILPFLLVYFFLAYLIYRNQIMNVYVHTYQSGGQLWPIVHNTTIFSLVFTQIIAVGVFGLRKASVPSAFTIPLIIFTLLFNEYCRKRFHPIFKKFPAEALIRMDRQDEEHGRMREISQQLHSAYCQFGATSKGSFEDVHLRHCSNRHTSADPEDIINLPAEKEPAYKNDGSSSSSSSACTSLEIEQVK
ncbi:CSC1-like protein RXW8 isoform X2 [Impatiens glandulifera]|uniref:CSC1-like protein RXW8 isoform X2 n=1 Tax=Impatiens glandulifera TaxID=253017 RepID=UPI001FB197C3|nr:CSC1-like protein RXW8 isoform X2 [Impatiens glandulifera]